MRPAGFVGRRDELAVLDAAARSAQTGEPRFVVVGGAAGVGKTALMERTGSLRPGRRAGGEADVGHPVQVRQFRGW